jgi:hypothetical protein
VVALAVLPLRSGGVFCPSEASTGGGDPHVVTDPALTWERVSGH